MSDSHLAYQQSKQQMLTLAAIMFTSIVAAIVASTYITMSLMKGEVAGAVAATQAQSSNMNSCVDTKAVAERAAAAAVASNDSKHQEYKHHEGHAAMPARGNGSSWGMMPTGRAMTNNVNTVSHVTNTNTDNSTHWADNSKGKTEVTNNSTNNNTVNQNGLVNTNHQDLSNKQVVKPENSIDNEYNKNSKNTDNSQVTKDSNNTHTDNSVKNSHNTDNSKNDVKLLTL